VIEAAGIRHGGVERPLAGVAERGMAKIMRERECLGQILVDAERAREAAGNLRNFEAMGQPRAIMITFVIDEDLGLVVEAAECGGMEDAVAVARIERAGRARRLGDEPATAFPLVDGVSGKRPCVRGRVANRVNSTLGFAVLVD
jgi:hypothetical protein